MIFVSTISCMKKYDSQNDFIDGLSKVSKNGLYGFINEQGEEVIPLIYTATANYISEGLIWVWKMNDGEEQWGFIDRHGKEIIPLIYGCASDFNNGLALVCDKVEHKRGYIDTSGNIVIPIIYDRTYHDDGEPNVIAVKKDSKWAIIDRYGKEITPFMYDDVKSYGEGLFAVEQNDKWGFINTEGEALIPFNYDYVIFGFDEGYALVTIKDVKFFIDKDANFYQYVESEMRKDGTRTFERGAKLQGKHVIVRQ